MRTAKFVRWLQMQTVSLSVELFMAQPLVDQEPLNSDLSTDQHGDKIKERQTFGRGFYNSPEFHAVVSS